MTDETLTIAAVNHAPEPPELGPSPDAPSRCVAVTFYEDRAEVVRQRCTQLRAGPQWVRLDGASPTLSDATVQAKVVGSGARVVTARVVRKVVLSGELGFEEIQRLEAEATEATEVAKAATAAAGRIGAAQAQMNTLLREWTQTFSTIPRGSKAGGYEQWRETYCATRNRHADLLGQWHDAKARREDAETIKRRADARLAGGQAKTPRVQAAIEVLVDAEVAEEATVEVRYRTPCALWRPEYVVRLGDVDEHGGAEIEIVVFGTIWQRTGEVWEDVRGSYSTARPAAASSAPLLTEDVLAKRRRSSDERRDVQIAVRETKVSVAGLGGNAQEVEEAPGLDDGGEPLVLASESPVSFTSDGEPLRVELQRITVPVTIRRLFVPELQGVAHVVATGTLRGGPILAGPCQIVRGGGLIGRTQMKFIADGERFEIGLGPDDALRCRRHRREERDTSVMGTQTITRTVTLYVSNVSGEPKTVDIQERIPVSEIDDVTIEPTTVKGWAIHPQHGFATQTVELAARGNDKVELAYTIKAKSNVHLPF